jgi:hypothetical protein
MGFLSGKTRQFTYFASQLGERAWRGKDVLDFGGNIGNILRDPNSTIEVERYWCIDVDAEAVEAGRRAYPQGHWLHYDRHCFFFNPRGVPRLKLPPIEQRFDYIVAYSVFTNTPTTEMLEMVEQLRGLLKGGGALAFTFIDPHHHSWPGRYGGDNLRWRLDAIKAGENRDVDADALADRARGASWCIVVNGADLYVETEEVAPCEPERQKSFYVFHSAEYIKSLFPEAAILPPANDEMQHCCIIRSA